MCRDRRTVGYATVVQVGRAGTLGLEVDDRSDLQIIEAEIALRLPNQSGPIAPLHSGDLTSWILPLDGRLNIAGAEVEIPNFPQIDPGDSGWVRIYPLAAYLWKDVDVGTSLALRDDLHGGDDRGAATVVRLNRAGAVATR